LQFERHPGSFKKDELVIRDSSGAYSADYQALAKGFYLGF
jgi:hypothetical protein